MATGNDGNEPLLVDEDLDDDNNDLSDPASHLDEKPLFTKIRQPRDKYQRAYAVFCLLGINSLVPWCFFITANDYWMYKFRPVYPNGTASGNDHPNSRAGHLFDKNDLQASFASYLSIVSALPNTIFLIGCIFVGNRLSLKSRMVGSQTLILVLFLLTTFLVKVNTDTWQSGFLTITLITVALVNASSAVFGSSLFCIVGRFTPRYITSMSGGQALGGIFTALAQVLALWIGAGPILSGFLYFLIGDAVLLLSLVAYVLLEKDAFFRYHMLHEQLLPRNFEANLVVNAERSDRNVVSYARVARKIWKHGLSIFIVFFVTCSVSPGVTVLIESSGKGKGHVWNDIYFVPVVAYLIFSAGDYVGRLLAGIFQWPKGKPWQVIGLGVSRFLLIPALVLCNAQPRHRLPVYIDDDLAYVVITIALALSNGYLCNLAFIYAAMVVEPWEKETACAMMGAFLGLGLSMGSALSLAIVKSL